MVMKAADVRGVCPKANVRRNYPGADVWRGRLFRIRFKVLLYDDMVGVVSSGHVKKMAVKSFDPP